MKSALVVYESLFGDAHTVAHAIAEGLSATLPAVVIEARQAPEQLGPDVGLLVVGGPNHQFGMPRPASRTQAARTTDVRLRAVDEGLREWLGRLRPGDGRPAAAFDTRLVHPRFLDHVDRAARQEEHLLRAHGFDVVVPAEHFYVLDTEGPLRDGEEERARRWGETLADRFAMTRG